MIKDSNLTGVIKQFSNLDPTSHLTDPEQRRKIDLVKTEEEVKKPKRKVIEPIEIPEILSVPRLRHLDTMTTKHYAKPPESYNTGPEIPVGLSKRFTQDKIHEGKILKQLDRELANDARKNNQTANEGGDN